MRDDVTSGFFSSGGCPPGGKPIGPGGKPIGPGGGKPIGPGGGPPGGKPIGPGGKPGGMAGFSASTVGSLTSCFVIVLIKLATLYAVRSMISALYSCAYFSSAQFTSLRNWYL